MNNEDWENYDHALILADAVDILTPPPKVGITRSHVISKSGIFRLARKTVALYNIGIQSSGGWGRLWIYDNEGNEVMFWPSPFTGSFTPCEPCCWGGLIVASMCGPGADTAITVSWREP